MSISLELLLGPPPPGTPAQLRQLRSNDGIALRLISNTRDDQLMLLSSPGSLPRDSELASAPLLWHHTLEHPQRRGMRLSLMVRPGNARLYLMDVWPRHCVQQQALVEVLDEHTRRHRLWRETLEPVEGEEDDEVDDSVSTPGRGTVPPHRFA